MTDEYLRCVVQYNDGPAALEQDGRAFIEADAINRQLADMRWEGYVRDIRYAGKLSHSEQERSVPVPITFELRKDCLDERQLPTPGTYWQTIDTADQWSWEPLDADQFEQYQRELQQDAGYEIFDRAGAELDMAIQTRNDGRAAELAESSEWEQFTGQ
jgi:hypothetical protein